MATKKKKVKQVSEKVLKENQLKQILLDQASLLCLEGIDELLQGDVKLDQIDFDSLRQEIMVAFENLGKGFELTVGVDLSCFGLAEAYAAFKEDPDVCVKCDKKEFCKMEIANRSSINQGEVETGVIEEAKEVEEVVEVKEDPEEEEEVEAEAVIKDVLMKSLKRNKQVKEIKSKKIEDLNGLVNPYRGNSIVGVAFALLAEKSQSLDSLVIELQAKFPKKDEVAIRRALHFMFDHGKMFFAIEQDDDGNLSLFETIIKR